MQGLWLWTAKYIHLFTWSASWISIEKGIHSLHCTGLQLYDKSSPKFEKNITSKFQLWEWDQAIHCIHVIQAMLGARKTSPWTMSHNFVFIMRKCVINNVWMPTVKKETDHESFSEQTCRRLPEPPKNSWKAAVLSNTCHCRICFLNKWIYNFVGLFFSLSALVIIHYDACIRGHRIVLL